MDPKKETATVWPAAVEGKKTTEPAHVALPQIAPDNEALDLDAVARFALLAGVLP